MDILGKFNYIMKKILAALLIFTASVSAIGKDLPGVAYDFPLTRVIDGDTVAFRATFLPAPLHQELSIRVYGVDTPEKGARAKCAIEDQRGRAAAAFTKEQINKSHTHQVIIMAWDKYGGRVLGDILLDGQSLRSLLIQNGVAREYYGKSKTSWC